jgi:hypothetical protein
MTKTYIQLASTPSTTVSLVPLPNPSDHDPAYVYNRHKMWLGRNLNRTRSGAMHGFMPQEALKSWSGLLDDHHKKPSAGNWLLFRMGATLWFSKGKSFPWFGPAAHSFGPNKLPAQVPIDLERASFPLLACNLLPVQIKRTTTLSLPGHSYSATFEIDVYGSKNGACHLYLEYYAKRT